MINSTMIKDRFQGRRKKEEQRRMAEQVAREELENVENLAKFLEEHFSPEARQSAVNGPSFRDLAEAKRLAAVALKR